MSVFSQNSPHPQKSVQDRLARLQVHLPSEHNLHDLQDVISSNARGATGSSVVEGEYPSPADSHDDDQ